MSEFKIGDRILKDIPSGMPPNVITGKTYSTWKGEIVAIRDLTGSKLSDHLLYQYKVKWEVLEDIDTTCKSCDTYELESNIRMDIEYQREIKLNMLLSS